MRADMYLQRAETFPEHSYIQQFESVGGARILLFMAIHVPLAFIMQEVRFIATLHAIVSFTVALFIALTSRRIEHVIYAASYIAGAEVLWRMTQADVFWEFGKYATVVVLSCAAIHLGRVRGTIAALFYFALLLPSMLFVVEEKTWSQFREELSFNLSGPLSLAVSVFFLSQAQLTRKQMHRVILILIAPVIGVLALAIFGTVTKDIRWGTASNIAASGGFGPNQVSAMLGLGALLAFIFLLDSHASRPVKFLIFVTMIFLLIQAALTFSRAGLYLAVCGAVIAAFYLVRDRRTRLKLFFVGIMLFVIGNYLILPGLNAFTGGALVERFENTSLTGREELITSDLEIWKDNFFLGVGPGQAGYYPRLGRHVEAHTEFTRLLAEHGILGLLAILLIAVMALQSLRKSPGSRERAIAGAFIAWSLLYMMVNAMRLVAPAFLFGLASVYFLRDDYN